MGEGFFNGAGVAGEVEGACGAGDALGGVGGSHVGLGASLGALRRADGGQGLNDGAEFGVSDAETFDGLGVELGDFGPIEVFGESDEALAAGQVELVPCAAQQFPIYRGLAVEGGLKNVLHGVVLEEGF